MTKRTTNPDFLNGVPELLVFELVGRRPMYGYEIVQAIQVESSGALAFGEGCIYPLLHKLEARGDLSSRRMDVGGRTRVMYRVTPKGVKQFAESAVAWSTVATAVGNILQGGKHGQHHARSA
jgi:PadR family transcriptional regulator, regulatory protein PadR